VKPHLGVVFGSEFVILPAAGMCATRNPQVETFKRVAARHFVPVKTIEQQAVLLLHRTREPVASRDVDHQRNVAV
jgi:hypothetical protein